MKENIGPRIFVWGSQMYVTNKGVWTGKKHRVGYVARGDKTVGLQPAQMKIVTGLLLNIGKVVDYTQLLDFVYGSVNREPGDGMKVLKVQMCHCRKALSTLGIKIIAHHGIGAELVIT